VTSDLAGRDLADMPATEAIPVLVERYGNKLYRLGVRECGSEDEALDLLQDTLMLAYRNWGQFEGRSSPASWLYTIAVRACIRKHRLRSGEPAFVESLEELMPEPDVRMSVLPADDDPLSEAMRRQAQEDLDRAIAELPSEYRIPLLLKDLAELKISEVAEVLELNQATVKTRIHRARLLLRKALEGTLPKVPVPEEDLEHHMCLDLLQVKLKALDSGVDFPVPQAELCARCRAFFATLDFAHEFCVELGQGEMPEQLRELLLTDPEERWLGRPEGACR
jgi:RNA polymerase sigma-70 factor (ECF subfamily)